MLLDLLANQPSTDFLQDPVFLTILASIATIIAGLIGAFVTYWVYLRQRSKKEISYQIISDAPIATVSNKYKDQVTILFKGKPVEDARQIVLTIRNSGNAAVKREDYDESIRFIFQGSEVFGSEVLATEPAKLISSINKKTFETDVYYEPSTGIPTSITGFQKFLLNPKQSVTFTFLLDRAYQKLEVEGRIVDGKIIKYSEKSPKYDNYRQLSVWAVVLIAVASASLLTLEPLIIGTIAFAGLILSFALLHYFNVIKEKE